MASARNSTVSKSSSSASTTETYLLEAVNQLLSDTTFKLGTERMKKAVAAALKLKEWIPLNMENVLFLESELLKHFRRCTRDGLSTQDGREHFIGLFHHLRCSTAFSNLWKVFLAPVCIEVAEDPIFYQYLTRFFLKKFIKQNFPLPATDTSSSPSFSLTFEQSNALRYVAGYVCGKLHKKMKADKQEDLALGLEDMIDTDKSDKTVLTAKWVNLVDRGGLVHVNNKVFVLFVNMERVIQGILRTGKASDTLPNRKDLLLKLVMEDSGVQSGWKNIAVEIEEAKKSILFTKIANLYITIRGFSFAGSYVELYKQSTKKTLQGSKALRTKLNAESSKEESED